MRSILRFIDKQIKDAIERYALSIDCTYIRDQELLVKWSKNNKFGDIVMEPIKFEIEGKK